MGIGIGMKKNLILYQYQHQHQYQYQYQHQHQHQHYNTIMSPCSECSQLYYDNFVDSMDKDMKSYIYRINKGLRSSESCWIPLITRVVNYFEKAGVTINGHCGNCITNNTNTRDMIISAGVIFMFEILIDYKRLTTTNVLFTHIRFSKIIKSKLDRFNTIDIPVSTLWKGSDYYHNALFGYPLPSPFIE